MGKILIEIPESIHDKLRHDKIYKKTDIKIIIIDILTEHYNTR